MPKIGRNEPCPCGSGKKYKKCCGAPQHEIQPPQGQVIEIRTFDDPALKTPCTPVEDEERIDFVDDMIATLKATENGVGLAAPQIGILKRVILIRSTIMINPEITWKSQRHSAMEEGCLSYPDVWVEVDRPHSVKVKYYERYGVEKEEKYSGLEAKIIQHEIDHLDGVCKIRDFWSRQKSLTELANQAQDLDMGY